MKKQLIALILASMASFSLQAMLPILGPAGPPPAPAVPTPWPPPRVTPGAATPCRFVVDLNTFRDFQITVDPTLFTNGLKMRFQKLTPRPVAVARKAVKMNPATGDFLTTGAWQGAGFVGNKQGIDNVVAASYMQGRLTVQTPPSSAAPGVLTTKTELVAGTSKQNVQGMYIIPDPAEVNEDTIAGYLAPNGGLTAVYIDREGNQNDLPYECTWW